MPLVKQTHWHFYGRLNIRSHLSSGLVSLWHFLSRKWGLSRSCSPCRAPALNAPVVRLIWGEIRLITPRCVLYHLWATYMEFVQGGFALPGLQECHSGDAVLSERQLDRHKNTFLAFTCDIIIYWPLVAPVGIKIDACCISSFIYTY